MEKVFQQVGVQELHPPYTATIGTTLLARTMERTPPASAEARRGHLESLPAAGFTPHQHAELVDDVVATGLPVDNIRSLTRRRNGYDTEGALGSFGTGQANYGDLSMYDLLYRHMPEKQLTTIQHEVLHANSPLDERNDRQYGGRAERLEARDFAENVASQSLLTGKWIDGYQHYLAVQYSQGLIDWGTFVEETFAIMGEQATTNRKHLEQTQEAQRKVFLRKRALGVIDPRTTFTELVSRPAASGETPLRGIDKILGRLVHGVHDYQGLVTHATQLKDRFRGRARPEMTWPLPRTERITIILTPLGALVLTSEDLDADMFGRRKRAGQPFINYF